MNLGTDGTFTGFLDSKIRVRPVCPRISVPEFPFAMARHAAVDLAQVVNARHDPLAPDRLPVADLDALRGDLVAAGLRLRNDEYAHDKLARLRSMYEPYVHATGRNLMLTLPVWRPAEKKRDNWQAGPWDRLIQARGLAILGQKRSAPRAFPGEDHF